MSNLRNTAKSALWSLLSLILVLGTVSGQSKKIEPTRHPFLWRIEGKDSKATNWLYGTMHLGDDRLVALPDVVEEARDAADAVYCELAFDKLMAERNTVMKLMMAPPGESLDEVLPEALYDRLEARLEKLSVSMAQVKSMRVWAVGMILAQSEAAKLGMKKSLDKMLYDDAKRDDKEVGGLETIEEQLHAIGSCAIEDYIESLRVSLDLADKFEAQGKTGFGLMLESYLTGSEKIILDLIEQSMSPDVDLNRRLTKPVLEDRNIRMTNRIIKKLKENMPKKHFFAIGAMHYVGDMGIVVLMRKKGYTITRIQPPTASWKEFVAMRYNLTRLRNKVKRLEKRLEAVKK